MCVLPHVGTHREYSVCQAAPSPLRFEVSVTQAESRNGQLHVTLEDGNLPQKTNQQIVKSSQLHLSHERWRQQLGGIWLVQCGSVISGIPMSKDFGKDGHSYAHANRDTVS